MGRYVCMYVRVRVRVHVWDLVALVEQSIS